MQVGFVGALTLLFVALKLLNVIQWDWVWVVSPLWISALIVIAILVIWIIGIIAIAAFSKK